jgi:hypothetical protein
MTSLGAACSAFDVGIPDRKDLMAGLTGIFGFLTGYIVPFVLVLSLLVFVHEMGHYLVGRWSGIRILAFSVGFGPELFGLPTSMERAGSFRHPARRLCQILRRRGCSSKPGRGQPCAMSDEERAGPSLAPSSGSGPPRWLPGRLPISSWRSPFSPCSLRSMASRSPIPSWPRSSRAASAAKPAYCRVTCWWRSTAPRSDIRRRAPLCQHPPDAENRRDDRAQRREARSADGAGSAPT